MPTSSEIAKDKALIARVKTDVKTKVMTKEGRMRFYSYMEKTYLELYNKAKAWQEIEDNLKQWRGADYCVKELASLRKYILRRVEEKLPVYKTRKDAGWF